MKLLVRLTSVTIFQYPQSDRALCNVFADRIIVQNSELSVSPIGSSPLQQIAAEIDGAPNGLSVSPIGSSPLQLRYHVTDEFPRTGFQYPQSDRALCNWH